MLDNQALISYVAEELDGLVGAAYQDPAGQDRITILSDVSEPEPVTGTQPQDRTYTVQKGDCLWTVSYTHLLLHQGQAALIHKPDSLGAVGQDQHHHVRLGQQVVQAVDGKYLIKSGNGAVHCTL